MFVYEVTFTDGRGETDHSVFTAESEAEAESLWEKNQNGDTSNAEVLDVTKHGKYSIDDVFEELRAEILDRGVRDEFR